MSDSFQERLIEISIKLAGDTKTNQPTTFAESGTDTVTISGTRTKVRIQNSGAPGGSSASVEIYGMKESLMNQLSTLGLVFNLVPRNTMTISAGNPTDGMSAVFGGTIVASYGDFNQAPDVPFRFECNSGLADAVAPAAVSSYPGSTDVATIMSGLARQMNVGFENSGVDLKLASPYFSGNVWTQIQACAEHAGINAEVINGNVLAIWPKGGSRTGTSEIPLISKNTGMIGYPGYTQQGIIVRSVFNPQISFGGLIQVESRLEKANGQWAVNKLDLALDSKVPKGQWMSTIYAYNPKYPKPIPPQVGD